MRLAVFEEVDRAPQIMFEQLARAGLAVHAGEHAGVRSGIDHKIGGGQRFKIGRAADIRVNNFHAEPGQFTAVEFAAGPDEIIHAHNLQTRRRFQQRPRERAAHETTAASDQDFHFISATDLHYWAGDLQNK